MPTHSASSPISIPDVDVWSFFFERTDLDYPEDHEIFVDLSNSRRHTFQSLRQTSIEIGRGLVTKWNWQKGDIMAIFSPNSADIGTIVAATLWAGGVVCPLNNLYTVGELSSLLRSSGAKALTTHVSCLDTAREAALIVGLPLNRIILIGEPDVKGKTKYFEELREERVVVKKATVYPKEDLSFLVYSSGTTGLPKGVMLSHENIVANILQALDADRDAVNWRNDSMISFLPMFHIYGIAALIFVPIYKGVTMYIMQRFDLDQFLSSIQTDKVTIAYVVPPILRLLAKHPLIDKFDLSSLRILHSAAAPLTHDLIEMIYSRLKIPIKQSYGMSEAAPAITTQKTAEWNKPVGSVGKLVPSMSVKIVSNGSEVSIGQEGEIWLRGPNIFKGYYQNPSATAEAFTDGWFRSGDIGYVDASGNLFLTDRFKELIKYNGFQVAPAQLEGLLLGHPAVDDVAVVGVYDRQRETELPRAYVVPSKGYEAGEKLETEIRAWLDGKVAPHKRLRGGVRFVEAIPKSTAGKVLRRILVEQAKLEERNVPSKL